MATPRPPLRGCDVRLTERDLVVGERRIPRRAITGVEFDRHGSGPGVMIFLGKGGELARVEFTGPQRRELAEIERQLAPRPGKRAIKVMLDREDYAPGETVRGHVVVDWPKPSPVRGVRVGLVGVEQTEIRVTHGHGKRRHTVRYRGVNEIIAEELRLWGGPRVGWWKAAGDGLRRLFTRLDYKDLPAGRHEFPLDFALPRRALPCFEGRHAKIGYRLYAHVDVPLGFDLAFEGVLSVVGPRDARIEARNWGREFEAGGLLKPFRAALKIALDIHETRLQPGARLGGVVKVENRGEKRLRAVELELLARERAWARGHERMTEHVLESGRLRIPDPEADRQKAEFGIRLPPGAAAYDGRHSSVELVLRVSLDVALGFDAAIEVPLSTSP